MSRAELTVDEWVLGMGEADESLLLHVFQILPKKAKKRRKGPFYPKKKIYGRDKDVILTVHGTISLPGELAVSVERDLQKFEQSSIISV